MKTLGKMLIFPSWTLIFLVLKLKLIKDFGLSVESFIYNSHVYIIIYYILKLLESREVAWSTGEDGSTEDMGPEAEAAYEKFLTGQM